ncbi:MAG: PRC-barrel domain-containing protein [Candidatus Paceibacterota bacterium]
MRYRDSHLTGVPVYTRSGNHVGRLVGFVIESDTHEVVQYAVKKSGTLELILPKEFLVNRTQVVSVSDEKMVVEDAAVAEKAKVAAKKQVTESATNTVGVTRSME